MERVITFPEAVREEIPAIKHQARSRTVAVSPDVMRRHRLITGEDDPAMAAYKMLRTQLLRRMKAHDWRSLAVTSVAPGEGKTLTAINLAISLAREGNYSVLLVDLDLRRPSIARYFGFGSMLGIRDYLEETAPLHDILVHPGIERLVIMPGGEPVRDSSERLTSQRMVHLARELRGRYPDRLVIFDLPPLLAADDVLAFAPCIDAAVLVVEEGRTKRDDVARAVAMLDGINVAATVLNKSQSPGPGYY